MQVTGLASLNGRTVQTKTQLKELIKSEPNSVRLVPIAVNWGPSEFAARGPADTLPAEIEFVVTPWHGKWVATIGHGKNGLTVK
jgi:hypothetical protein